MRERRELGGDDLALLERGLRHATETTSAAELDRRLDDLGWSDALAVDRRTAVSVLFELQGRSVATSSALDAVLATALGAAAGPAVVLPALGTIDPPGREGEVVGLASAGITGSASALIATADEVLAVPVGALQVEPVRGLDPELGLVAVTATGVTGERIGSVAWAEVLAAGHLALAHELVGVSRAMLELARQYAIERVQFDRPIGQFQAVRHRLAEALVAIESAADAAEAAWDDGSPFAAAAAKAIAGRGARVAAKHCQQVLAGIGFTLEHPFHRHLRRALVLDRLLGSSKHLTLRMGEQLLRSGALPSMVPL